MIFTFALKGTANNSTVKYLKNFKKIILTRIANGWLDKDQFIKYKPKVKEVTRDYLTIEELELMMNKQFVSDRIVQVRDILSTHNSPLPTHPLA